MVRIQVNIFITEGSGWRLLSGGRIRGSENGVGVDITRGGTLYEEESAFRPINQWIMVA